MYSLVSLDEVEKALDKAKLCAFDTETDGFYGTIELAQFYQEGWDEALMVRSPDPYMLAILMTDQQFVSHLAHYDISTIQEQTKTAWIPKKFHCSFYAARLHYYDKEKFGLDSVMTYALNFDPYIKHGLIKKDMQKSKWAGLLTEDQLKYAALDVLYLLDVWNAVSSATEQFNYKLDIKFTEHCLDFQRVGMPVLGSAIQAKFVANEKSIKEMAIPINVNSWKQVRPYIGEETSDDLALAIHCLNGNTKAGDVRKVRKLIKQNSFLKKFDVEEGRIYGKFLPTARSGRCTSKDQNLQQLPNATKDAFGVEEESGRILVYSDYSQLELRSACIITNETKMEELYRENVDLHTYTAEMLFGSCEGKQRQIGKTCNFNLVYAGSANMLGNILIKEANIMLPTHDLYEYKRIWHKLWPSLTRWQHKALAAWKNGQAWQTPLGRRYVGKLYTDQANIQVQGFGAEVAKIATHYMKSGLDKLPNTVICDFIHDSWIIECDNNKQIYEDAAEIISVAMQKSWVESSKTAPVTDLPMPVKVNVGFNWGNIEKDFVYKLEVD